LPLADEGPLAMLVVEINVITTIDVTAISFDVIFLTFTLFSVPLHKNSK
jgi:hypothetical protein